MSTSDLIRRARELAKLREKASPGPWKVVLDEKRYDDEDDKYWNLGYAIPERNWHDLRLISYELDDPHVWCTAGFHDKASATLAAAAPEMAELLEKLVEAFQDELSEYGQHKATCPRARASGDAYFRVACTCGFDALRGMSPDPKDET